MDNISNFIKNISNSNLNILNGNSPKNTPRNTPSNSIDNTNDNRYNDDDIESPKINIEIDIQNIENDCIIDYRNDYSPKFIKKEDNNNILKGISHLLPFKLSMNNLKIDNKLNSEKEQNEDYDVESLNGKRSDAQLNYNNNNSVSPITILNKKMNNINNSSENINKNEIKDIDTSNIIKEEVLNVKMSDNQNNNQDVNEAVNSGSIDEPIIIEDNDNNESESNNESEPNKESESNKEPVELIKKRLLTKEEEELETKLATHNAMILLGEQIAEKKLIEKLMEKRQDDLLKDFDSLILSDEEYEELWEDDFSKDDFIRNWIENNTEVFNKFNIKNQKVKEDFAKFSIAYSILIKKNEEFDEKLEEVKNDLKEREEELEENIKELDEKDEANGKLVEKINTYDERIRKIKIYYVNKNNRNSIELITICALSNLLNFSINHYGIRYHIKLSYSIMIMLINLFSGFIKIFGKSLLILFNFIFNLNIIYSFIFVLGMIQMYQFGVKIVKEEDRKKIMNDFNNLKNRINCFNKPKKD